MNCIEKFNIINQTKLQRKSIVCAGCSKWLTSAIFRHLDGLNYCGKCSETGEQLAARQETLEEIIVQQDYKYPCGFKECDHIESLHNIQQHMDGCLYGSIKCLYCETKVANEFQIATHLNEVHSDIIQNLTIEDPAVAIKLNIPLTSDKVFILKVKEHTFIVIVKLIDGSLSLLVGKLTVDAISNNDFIIENPTAEKVDTKGKILNIKDIFENSDIVCGSEISLKGEHNEEESREIELKLYLCGYELLALQRILDECPICFKHFSTEIYQCTNGHCVCHRCIANINTCAICRTIMNRTKFNLKHLLANLYFECPNADAGCLTVATGRDINSHATECLYRTVNCVECKKGYSKNNIIKHMQKEHKVWPNLRSLAYTIDNLALPNFTVYVQYKHSLFRCNTSEGTNNNLNCSVELLYSENVSEAHKYRYEVHILDKSRNCIANHIIGTSIGTQIDWNFCKQYLYKDNETHRLNIRYCVYEV